MRFFLLSLVVMMVLSGCVRAPRIDRAELDERYAETALAEGTLSSVPSRVEQGEPPVVVNWWYAGTNQGWHNLVYRQLTWDTTGRPVGIEKRYRIEQSQLAIRSTFDQTSDSTRWLSLYEAATDVPRPPDLLTSRQLPDSVSPQIVEPDQVEPNAFDPDPIVPR